MLLCFCIFKFNVRNSLFNFCFFLSQIRVEGEHHPHSSRKGAPFKQNGELHSCWKFGCFYGWINPGSKSMAVFCLWNHWMGLGKIFSSVSCLKHWKTLWAKSRIHFCAFRCAENMKIRLRSWILFHDFRCIGYNAIPICFSWPNSTGLMIWIDFTTTFPGTQFTTTFPGTQFRLGWAGSHGK